MITIVNVLLVLFFGLISALYYWTDDMLRSAAKCVPSILFFNFFLGQSQDNSIRPRVDKEKAECDHHVENTYLMRVSPRIVKESEKSRKEKEDNDDEKYVFMPSLQTSISPIDTSDMEIEKESKIIKELKMKELQLTENIRKKNRLVSKTKKHEAEVEKLCEKLRQMQKERSEVQHQWKVMADEYLVMKEKLRSLEELVWNKSKRIRELWSFIEILDCTNIKVNRRAEMWEGNAKQLEKDITVLKMQKTNTESNLQLSPNSVDWKAKIEDDIRLWRNWKPASQRRNGGMVNRRCVQTGEYMSIKSEQQIRKKVITQPPHPALQQWYSAPSVMTNDSIFNVDRGEGNVSPVLMNIVRTRELTKVSRNSRKCEDIIAEHLNKRVTERGSARLPVE